jgi:2-oxoacid dehydrogenases acyltransferase (catalytic domain)
MLLTVRWGQFKPSQPSRRVAKVGPNQTVTTTPRHARRRGHFKPPSRGQIRLSRPVVPTADGFGGHSLAVCSMVYLSITYDHRIVDGADAARFLGAIKNRLENADFAADL